MESSIAVDMNGKRLKVGQTVKVHQEESQWLATVKEVTNSPTEVGPGFWVDIDGGEGLEGMMSYILEITDEPFTLKHKEWVIPNTGE